jgi:hypothetical protein
VVCWWYNYQLDQLAINVNIISLHNFFWFLLVCTNWNSRRFNTVYNNILCALILISTIYTEKRTTIMWQEGLNYLYIYLSIFHLSGCVTFTFVFSFYIWKKLIRKVVILSTRNGVPKFSIMLYLCFFVFISFILMKFT